MAELTYSIKNIFNNQNGEGCLHHYEADAFNIPAYQRGYKWGSKSDNDPVPVLLDDLWSAFQKDPTKKYYLQYITISKKGTLMEVIDGQQRLTTLSIMLSAFSLLLCDLTNISLHKLKYAIRPSFFDSHIYPKDEFKRFIEQTWSEKGIELNGVTTNNQDVFYIHQASIKIYDFFRAKEFGLIEEFYNYLIDQVMIIVNSVESHIPGEKVFKNLNSKKVPLTEVDLIKALLLTKISRNAGNEESKKYFREVLEIRAAIGRKWDEISAQSNNAEFSSFYFSEGKGFEGLLLLVAAINGYSVSPDDNDRHYPLFNFFNNHSTNAKKLFEEICLFYDILYDWIENPKTHNLLGYAFFSKGSKQDFRFNFIKENHKLPKDELIQELIKIRNAKLSDNPLLLKYNESNNEIHNLLLVVNVFPKYIQLDTKHKEVKEVKFDFYAYQNLDWTLEHIFPQSPEGKDKVLTPEQKLKVIEMLGGADNIDPDIKNVLDLQKRDDAQKQLYYDALQSIGQLNEIGNMALLSHSVNASIGCGFFDEKRNLIVRHMQNGKFVPLHTFNVFSKTILGSTPGDLLAWSKDDIANHTTFLTDRVKELKAETV